MFECHEGRSLSLYMYKINESRVYVYEERRIPNAPIPNAQLPTKTD